MTHAVNPFTFLVDDRPIYGGAHWAISSHRCAPTIEGARNIAAKCVGATGKTYYIHRWDQRRSRWERVEQADPTRARRR